MKGETHDTFCTDDLGRELSRSIKKVSGGRLALRQLSNGDRGKRKAGGASASSRPGESFAEPDQEEAIRRSDLFLSKITSREISE